MTDFTNIRTALDNLIAVLDSATADLVGTANEQRRELLSLYGRMQATQDDLVELGSMVGETGAVMFDLAGLCDDVASKVQNTIEGGLDEIPSCNYEAFMGFCETCGKEIHEGEDYSFDGENGFVCGDCLNAESEQLTFDLAETVTHDVDTDAE